MDKVTAVARSRILKEGFFTNEILCNLPPLTRILFAGLWCIADREGRLEDRPERIRHEVLGYDEGVNADDMLAALDRANFIRRYAVGGVGFIQIVAWSKHQRPHMREAKSSIPPCNDHADDDPSGRVEARRNWFDDDHGTDLGSDEAQPRQCEGEPRQCEGEPRQCEGISKAPPRCSVSVSVSDSVLEPLRSNSSVVHTLKRARKNSRATLDVAEKLARLGIPVDVWTAFEEMRVKLRRPMTQRAADLVLSKLHALTQAGMSPVDVLNQSIENSWQGVFALNGVHRSTGGPRTKPYAQERDEARRRTMQGLTGFEPDAVKNGGDVIDVVAEVVRHER